ncbi:MAG TPA: carboxypeptidase regulatory-like domain-containing protein [Vicinamibacterales bacterium]|nr:carboxypeptidase regulatory-like domain-containing protein [Vicinamibacterales bacterium]
MFRLLTRSLLVAALVATAAPSFAQPAQTGTVQGVVRDATGGALPGVTITITSQDRGFSRSTVTDGVGRYVFPAVPIGPYRVVATLQGFETADAADNLVEVNRTTNVSFDMKIGALTDTVVVMGATPIVDATTVTQTTRLTRDEFDKLPVGRTYQSLIGAAPGVVGTGNVNSAGALAQNNLFIIDAVDTTDPTTGTFGTNLNFEAIQEVSVMTSAAGAEYGRAQGAIVSVVTKSGTNQFEGSAKYIFTNDNWDVQNTTTSEVTGASLERVKFDKVNPIYSFTGGGPIWRDRAWFFGTYELGKNTTPQRQTAGQIPEDYQQTTESPFVNVRGTVQLREGHTAWLKYYRSPTNGFVVDYWGASGEREALTAQNQTARNWAAQWSGVLRSNWSMEAAFADYSSYIGVVPFEPSGKLGNAPILNQAESKFYNGATFDGFVERPRQQFNIASNWFLTPGGRSHDVKVGIDFQNMESSALFQFPNAQYYVAASYDQASSTMVPLERRDYETGASTSSGKTIAFFARDKMEVTDRFFIEAGLRFENQTGTSDIGATTVDTTFMAPRLSGSYDLAGDGKTLVTGSYGRYHASILQGFSDQFAAVPQQQNYDLFTWDGNQYVFSRSVRVGASDFSPPDELKPSHMDEVTIGLQRQFGRTMGVGLRYINRNWGNIIDDIYTFRPDGSFNREVVNYDEAERKYRGVQMTLEKRFSNNWNAQASYTFSRTEGNHFSPVFSPLGDYLDAQCTTTLDPSIGTNGTIPCSEVNGGAAKYGRPGYDRPHNFKFAGAYVRPIGPINLTAGVVTDFISKARYQRQRSMTVLRPGTTTSAGRTATYFYEPAGSFQLDGLLNVTDFSTEATWRIAGSNQAGFKAEIFNLFNNEEKTANNNSAWCGATTTAACQTAVNNFGKASARGSFVQPRRYRFSLIYRF